MQNFHLEIKKLIILLNLLNCFYKWYSIDKLAPIYHSLFVILEKI
jgi:hypothetical protein